VSDIFIAFDVIYMSLHTKVFPIELILWVLEDTKLFHGSYSLKHQKNIGEGSGII
jgi:hypothetical protein